ncbi:hypothetical protein ACUY3L_04835 [Corynebacterium mastitidis]
MRNTSWATPPRTSCSPEALRGDVLTRNGLSWPWVMEGGVAVASLRAR